LYTCFYNRPIVHTPHHAANPQGITTVTPAPAATPQRRGSPSHEALTDILAEESRQNDELQSKYANLLTQVEAAKVALKKLQKNLTICSCASRLT
jgi:hypothetical protein